MKTSRQLLTLLLIAPILGCGDSPESTPKTLLELATGWSGGRTDPTCQKLGPRGEYLGEIPGSEYCQWPTVARGPEWSTVGAHRDSMFGLNRLTWERRFRSPAGASQLADSLSKEFRAQGLGERPCPNSGREWKTKNLVVQFTLGPPHGGMTMVIVHVTTRPEGIPALWCPKGADAKPIAD